MAGLVTFEGTTVGGVAASFREAVEDYLELSGRREKRISSRTRKLRCSYPSVLHRRAAEQATVRGISLNRLLQQREMSAHASGSVNDDTVDTTPPARLTARPCLLSTRQELY